MARAGKSLLVTGSLGSRAGDAASEVAAPLPGATRAKQNNKKKGKKKNGTDLGVGR